MLRKPAGYIVIFLAIFAFLGNVNLLFAQTFEDSNVFILKTTTAGELPGSYTLICSGSTTSTITVAWSGNISEPHSITLYHSTSSTGILDGSRDTLASSPAISTGSGIYTQTGLPENTDHYYLLTWTVDIQTTDSNVAACRTTQEVPEAPSVLNVWATGPSSLYVTWKDNAARPHTFHLERIKVTPATSSNVTATTLSSSQIRLDWENPTNSQPYKGPLYHVIERDTNSSFSSPATIQRAFDKDVTATSTDTNYTYTDSGLSADTTYYYRLKACSFLRVNLNRNNPNQFTPICSPVSPTVTASTLAGRQPFAGVFAFFSNLFNRVLAAVQRENIGGKELTDAQFNSYFQQFIIDGRNPGLNLTVKQKFNLSVYQDENLEPDTIYLYRVKGLYTDAAGGESEYFEISAGKTLPAGTGIPTTIYACIRNNLCGVVSATTTPGGVLENQCVNSGGQPTNALCRNVGTSRQVFEETR